MQYKNGKMIITLIAIDTMIGYYFRLVVCDFYQLRIKYLNFDDFFIETIIVCFEQTRRLSRYVIRSVNSDN